LCFFCVFFFFIRVINRLVLLAPLLCQGLARLRTADGRGWLSEQLNPLSGHRGPVLKLLPLPTLLSFRVAIPEVYKT